MPLRQIAKAELVRAAHVARACASALAAVAVLAAFAPATTGHQTSSEAAKASAKPCHKVRGPFHVRGTKVIGANGKPLIPYGITVPGLSNADYQPFVQLDDAKIRATASAWCAPPRWPNICI